jgi:hypothetical protein
MNAMPWPVCELRDKQIMAECLLASIHANEPPAPPVIRSKAEVLAHAAGQRRRAAAMRAEALDMRHRLAK